MLSSVYLVEYTLHQNVTIEIYTRNFARHITVPSPNLAFLCRNLDYNPYSINLYKHQRIRDMQHLKDSLEEKREELPQYKSDACINQFRYSVLKVIKVAGKHILNIFSRFAVERNV